MWRERVLYQHIPFIQTKHINTIWPSGGTTSVWLSSQQATAILNARSLSTALDVCLLQYLWLDSSWAFFAQSRFESPVRSQSVVRRFSIRANVSLDRSKLRHTCWYNLYDGNCHRFSGLSLYILAVATLNGSYIARVPSQTRFWFESHSFNKCIPKWSYSVLDQRNISNEYTWVRWILIPSLIHLHKRSLTIPPALLASLQFVAVLYAFDSSEEPNSQAPTGFSCLKWFIRSIVLALFVDHDLFWNLWCCIVCSHCDFRDI